MSEKLALLVDWLGFLCLSVVFFFNYTITGIFFVSFCPFLKIYYLWPHWVFAAVHGLSWVVASGCYNLVVLHRLLVEVTSLAAEHGL